MRTVLKYLALLALLALTSLALCGCSETRQVENQAYVLAMGFDRTESGQLRLSVRIPKISGGAQESGSSAEGSGDDYLYIDASAQDYERALKKLEIAVPRNLNLAQLKIIVLSRALAEEDCARLIGHIAQTERLFTAARVVVCEGEAADFIGALTPVFGTRLSNEITSTFEYYIGRGLLPRSRLADLYYLTNSVYSDPMASYAKLSDADKPPSDSGGSEGGSGASGGGSGGGSDGGSGSQKRVIEYLGSAVFSGGRLVGTFDAQQSAIANLLCGSTRYFRYSLGEQSVELSPSKRALSVDTDGAFPRIRVDLSLSVGIQDAEPDYSALENALRADIEALIRQAQRMGAEPFGFAERAAGGFLTFDEWRDYGWPERFRQAEIEINLRFKRSDA